LLRKTDRVSQRILICRAIAALALPAQVKSVLHEKRENTQK
jgi:hypothetical protein